MFWRAGPANGYRHSFFLGNGTIGAGQWCTVDKERLSLNHVRARRENKYGTYVRPDVSHNAQMAAADQDSGKPEAIPGVKLISTAGFGMKHDIRGSGALV